MNGLEFNNKFKGSKTHSALSSFSIFYHPFITLKYLKKKNIIRARSGLEERVLLGGSH